MFLVAESAAVSMSPDPGYRGYSLQNSLMKHSELSLMRENWFIGRFEISPPFTLCHGGALHCTALHCTALHCTVLHCTALHCTALHCTALHCTALHCTALHCTALHCTALHCTALHCTAHHHRPPAKTTSEPQHQFQSWFCSVDTR